MAAASVAWTMWAALAVAFSPVWVQLALEVPRAPYGWSVLLAPALLLRAARSEPTQPIRPAWGGALLVAGLGAEALGLLGGSWSIARVGLPLAVVGMALWTGAPGWRAALLAFGLVPVPTSVYLLTTPGWESALAAAGAGVGSGLGADLTVSGPLIRLGDAHLELRPIHSGVHLALVAAELAWYRSVRLGASWTRGLLGAGAGAIAAVPLQLAAVVVAVGLLVAGAPAWAAGWLDSGVWTATAGIGLVWIERATRSRIPRDARNA